MFAPRMAAKYYTKCNIANVQYFPRHFSFDPHGQEPELAVQYLRLLAAIPRLGRGRDV